MSFAHKVKEKTQPNTLIDLLNQLLANTIDFKLPPDSIREEDPTLAPIARMASEGALATAVSPKAASFDS